MHLPTADSAFLRPRLLPKHECTSKPARAISVRREADVVNRLTRVPVHSLFRHNRSLIRAACADGLARTHKRTEPQTVVIEVIDICRHPQNLAALTSSRACASCACRSL